MSTHGALLEVHGIGILLLFWAFSEAGWLKKIGVGRVMSRWVSWVKGKFSKFWVVV